MEIHDIIRREIDARGCTQTWVIRQMNAVNPKLDMGKDKFSSLLRGKRKMTADELIAFCLATSTNPDAFLRADQTPY